MIINRNCWHMRVARLAANPEEHYEPRDLCSHFWMMIGGTVYLVMFSAIAVVFSPIWLPVVGFCIIRDWWKKRHPDKPNKPDKVKERSLVGAWIHSKAGSYCPTIEVRD